MDKMRLGLCDNYKNIICSALPVGPECCKYPIKAGCTQLLLLTHIASLKKKNYQLSEL